MALRIDGQQTGRRLSQTRPNPVLDGILGRRYGSTADAAPMRGRIVCAQDGTRLMLRSWPLDKPARAQLLMVHDYLDSGACYTALARAFGAQSIGCHAIDLRGHAGSAGTQGYVRTFADYSDDIQAGLNALPSGPQFLLGVGHGGLCVLDFAALRRPHLKGLIAIEPALSAEPPARTWKHTLMRAIGHIWPRLWVPKSLWPSVGFSPAPPSSQPPMASAPAPSAPVQHMRYAWWFDVPRVQQRVQSLARLPTPLLCIDDAYADNPPLLPALKPSKKPVDRVYLAHAGARVRQGKADAAVVDAVTRFIQGRLPKRATLSRATSSSPNPRARAPGKSRHNPRPGHTPSAAAATEPFAPSVAPSFTLNMPGAYPD